MLQPGATLGRYKILAELRSGGMGALYLGEHTGAAGFVRLVAIKVIHPHLAEDARLRRMFIDEATLCSRIDDPRVVRVEELGDAGGTLFLAMEYVRGFALAQLARALSAEGRSLGVEMSVHLASEIAMALHAAHETRGPNGEPLGIVHCDVSPHNVLIAQAGHVKLIDFGIAKARGYGRDRSSAAGSVRGKIAYMAPEQAAGRHLDRRTDVYALGIVLWEMLTSRRLFDAQNDFALLDIVRRPEVPPPSTLAEGVPPDLDRVVLDALAVEPERRLATAEEVRRRLLDAVPQARSVDAASVAALMRSSMADAIAAQNALLPRVVDPDSISTSVLEPSVMESRRVERPSNGAGPGQRGPWRLRAAIAAAVLVAAAAVAGVGLLRTGARVPASSALPEATPIATPEALTEYRQAMQAQRDGTFGSDVQHFARAVAMDPGFAAAHLRLAIATFSAVPNEAREHFQRAHQLRAALDEHDRALLDAMDPYIRQQPSNTAASEELLRDAMQRFPGDVEIAFYHANQHGSVEPKAGIADFDAIIAADPKFGGAYSRKGEDQVYLGDFDGTFATIQHCLREVPTATDCMMLRAAVDMQGGNAERLESDLRNIVALDPSSARAYRWLAAAVYVRGQPVDAAREALAQSRARAQEADRAMLRLEDDYALAALTGDFAAAERHVRDLEAIVASSPSRSAHGRVARMRVLLEREVGRAEAAADTSAEFLRKHDAWVPDPRAEDFAIARDPTPLMLATMRRAGSLAPADFEKRRAAWVREWRSALLPGYGSYAWLHGYAGVVETADDAAAALVALRSESGIPRFAPFTLADGDVGRTYLYAGRVDEAVVFLRRAARSGWVIEHPILQTRANAALAEALERSGDAAGACAAYQVVLDRWGDARPASVTASQAHVRWRALSCPGR